MPDTGPLEFKRHLRAEAVADDAVYLIAEREVIALQGISIEALAPLLDGTRDLTMLLRDLPAEISPEQARTTIAQLAQAGLLRSPPLRQAEYPAGGRGYWETLDLDPEAAQKQPVCLLIAGDIPVGTAAAARAALQASGLHLAPDNAALSIVLCDDYLADELAEIDADQRRAQRPWLLAKPTGLRMWIGPVFQQPEGVLSAPCWHCLASRIWGNRPAEAHVQQALGRTGPVPRPAISAPGFTTAALQLIALEAAKWLAGLRYPGQQTLWTLDSADLSGRRHEVRARPQCPQCGDPDLVRNRAWRPIKLSAPSPPDGAVNAAAGDFRQRFEHLISPVTGVVRELQEDQHDPAFGYSFRSGPTLLAGAGDVGTLRLTQQLENGGKGRDRRQAEISALAEALERYSGTWRGEEAQLMGSFAELKGNPEHPAIHPNDVQLYHENQFVSRTQWNAAHSLFQFVCDPLDEDAVLSWTPVWSLTAQQHRLLPTSLLYYGVPRPGPAAPVFAAADSNGAAAGADLADAVLRGLLELIERDAAALWWYNRTRQPGIDLDSCADPWIGRLRAAYRAEGREIWALDLTTDLGVPVVVALSARTDSAAQSTCGGEQIGFGFGAHPDPLQAVHGALTELNQLRTMLAHSSVSTSADADARHWLTTATRANQSYLLPAPGPARTMADLGGVGGCDTAADLTATLARQGLEVLVLEQTRPDVGAQVAKVIVPGLRHFWARFGPGRLYDTPVQLGRRSDPTPYGELNPIPIFL